MRYRRWLAMLLAFSLILAVLPGVSAKTSSEIQEEIDALEEEADRINAEIEALNDEIVQTKDQILSFAEQKLQIDREAELLRQTVENINAQIRQNNELIAARQTELDELQAEHERLLHNYQLRMRTIQERGDISIWSVIFSIDSFADMLTYRVMTEEIAKSDQNMLDALIKSSNVIAKAKDQLAEDKIELQNRKLELDEASRQLEEKRAQSDAMITELNADKQRLAIEVAQWEEQEAKLAEEIAEREKEYTRQKLIESGGHAYIPTETGFIFPLSLNGYVMLTSPYGMRTNPVTGIYTLHNGVDFGAYSGTPIYASKSGIVTTAALGGGWGNYVVLNHGDGFSSLYAHMTYYAVHVNDYVQRGDVIGYVGSTGNSTGPHLHFTIFYDGTSVNPMMYITLP